MMARPSVESVGIDIFKLASEVGWEIYPIGGKKETLQSVKRAMVLGLVLIG